MYPGITTETPGAAYDPGADWTAAIFNADPPPTLRRQSPSSFGVVQPTHLRLGALCHWLIDKHHFQPLATRSQHELARLRTRQGRLVIVYFSGSVVVQGADTAATIATLEQLCEVQG